MTIRFTTATSFCKRPLIFSNPWPMNTTPFWFTLPTMANLLAKTASSCTACPTTPLPMYKNTFPPLSGLPRKPPVTSDLICNVSAATHNNIILTTICFTAFWDWPESPFPNTILPWTFSPPAENKKTKPGQFARAFQYIA